MIFIVGKTCSGKDTIVNQLVKKHGYEKVITYTTRPMRPGEVQDKTYHFISKEEFLNKVNSDFFLEYKKYNTVEGEWYYGSAKEDFYDSDKKVIIVTPDGYRDIMYQLQRNHDTGNHHIFYIYVNNATMFNRLKKRGDDKDEAKRRVNRDNDDFKGVAEIVDRIIYNNDTASLDDVVAKLVSYISESKKEK